MNASLIACLCLVALPVVAQEVAPSPTVLSWRTLEVEDGSSVDYALQLPPDYRPADPYPVLFALPPGSQTRALVERGFELYWAEAARRGWVVVSPAAPAGLSFHAGAVELAEALADHVMREMLIEGGRLHLAGVSNGGRSAFHLATRAPERWSTLTALPGIPSSESDLDALDRLLALPIALYGGADDEGWADGMRSVRDQLVELGAAHVDFDLFDGEGHVPTSLEGGVRLFDRLEEHRALALGRVADERAVRSVLDDFHDAASKADGARYFAHFAPGARFLGTDATEHWSVSEFKNYTEPYFDRGQGWTYVATERWVTLSPKGDSAWFDERLHNEKYGETRGSGALVKIGDRWRISQYNLTIPVPNELAGDLVERIRGRTVSDTFLPPRERRRQLKTRGVVGRKFQTPPGPYGVRHFPPTTRKATAVEDPRSGGKKVSDTSQPARRAGVRVTGYLPLSIFAQRSSRLHIAAGSRNLMTLLIELLVTDLGFL